MVAAGDVEGVEFAVLGGGGGVGEEVLAAEFVLDLSEGGLELSGVVADVDDAATGGAGEVLEGGLAGVGGGEVVGEGVVGEVDGVEDGVGFLGGFGGGGEGLLGALVDAVGEEDEDLAAGLGGEFVVGGEVDGVVEEGAAGVGDGERAAAEAGETGAGGGGVDGGVVDGGGEFGEAGGEVGGEIDVDVEGDEEGEVAGGEDVFEEGDGVLLLEGKDALLAAGGVEEDADGEGEVFLLGEGLDGLGLVVVEDAAVGGGEVEDVAGFVADGEVGLDEAGGEVEGGGVEVGRGLGGGVGGGGRGVWRGGFLGVEARDGEQQGEGGGGEAHGAIRFSSGWASEGSRTQRSGGLVRLKDIGDDEGGGDGGCSVAATLVVSRERLSCAAGDMARERGIRMTLGTQRIWVGGLALALAAATGQGMAQVSQPATQTEQSVPNAPQPQTLPSLNTITPVAAALPDTPAAANGQASTSQTGTTAAEAAADQAATQDQGPPPASTRTALNTLNLNVQFHQIPFIVKDSKGHLVPGLTYRDVRVYENGLLQHIRFFSTDPLPLSVALVIDQSVTHDTMEKINDSLSALQGAFSPYDEVAVFTYNNGVKEQTTFTAAQSARLGAVLEQSKGQGRDALMGLSGPLAHDAVINNMPIDGVSDPGHIPGSMSFTVPKEYHTLNDAILQAAQSLATAPRDRRRIVYVISDGKEYGSKATQKQVIKYLLTNNIEVWATLVGDSSIKGLGFLDRMHLPLTMRDDILPKYTAETGGQTDPEFRPKGIENSFARITDEVRAQYTVGYNTHESPYNESYRHTEIRVLRPGLTIICKDGYYPSAADNTQARPRVTPPAATTPAPQ